MANPAPISLGQLFRYWKNLPHQLASIDLLEADLKANGYDAVMRRDREWFKTWSQDGKQSDLAPALKLIKEFEGCYLSAYPDPLSGGDPWTIGYGTTRYPGGQPIKRGDKINVIEADMLLRLEVDAVAAKLHTTIPYWNEMDDNQRCALISFAYNLGAGFYGSAGFETISKRLREKDWQAVPDAMLLYRNPGSNVEAGLKRRRIAEGDLWEQQHTRAVVFTPDSEFTYKITRNFTYGEFALYQEARRFDHQHQCDTAIRLAQFLERVRKEFGEKPITITSGYRPPAINKLVGGASSSEHLYDAPGVGAVDFFVVGEDIKKVQDWCDQVWPYSLGYGAPKGFVHLGIRAGSPRVRWVY